MPTKLLKNLHLLGEYAMSCKRDHIIKKVKARYCAKTHKFGIELPKTVEEALRIDERTGTDFWRPAIRLEMKNILPAFEFIDGDVVPKF